VRKGGFGGGERGEWMELGGRWFGELGEMRKLWECWWDGELGMWKLSIEADFSGFERSARGSVRRKRPP
jgi:hypothetical protein